MPAANDWTRYLGLVPVVLFVGLFIALKLWQRKLTQRHQEFADGHGRGLVEPVTPELTAPKPQPVSSRVYILVGSVLTLVVLGMGMLQDRVKPLGEPWVSVIPPAVILFTVLTILIVLTWTFGRTARLKRQALQMANTGDVDEAIRILESLRDQRPEDATVLNDLSVMYGVKKDWERALQSVDAQLKFVRGQPYLYSNRGLYLLRLHRLEEAEIAFREAGPSLTDDSVYLCNYAELLAELRRPEDARRILDQAVDVLGKLRFLPEQERRIRENEIDRVRMLVRV